MAGQVLVSSKIMNGQQNLRNGVVGYTGTWSPGYTSEVRWTVKNTLRTWNRNFTYRVVSCSVHIGSIARTKIIT